MSAIGVISKGDITITIKASSNSDIEDVYVKLVNANNSNDIRATRTNHIGCAVFKNIDYGMYTAFTRKNKRHSVPYKINHGCRNTHIEIKLPSKGIINNTGRILFIVKDGIYQQPVEGVVITQILPTNQPAQNTDMLGETEFNFGYTKENHTETDSAMLVTAQFEVLNPITDVKTVYNFNLLPGNTVITQLHFI